jgi:hypothetical protein
VIAPPMGKAGPACTAPPPFLTSARRRTRGWLPSVYYARRRFSTPAPAKKEPEQKQSNNQKGYALVVLYEYIEGGAGELHCAPPRTFLPCLITAPAGGFQPRGAPLRSAVAAFSSGPPATACYAEFGRRAALQCPYARGEAALEGFGDRF